MSGTPRGNPLTTTRPSGNGYSNSGEKSHDVSGGFMYAVRACEFCRKDVRMIFSRQMFVTISLLFSAVLIAGAVDARPQPFTRGSWTIAVLPDTQYYVRNDNDAPLFTEITQWLVDYREKMNIQLVLHLGDIVDRNNPKQWTNAKKSLKVLDGKLPYVLTVGNHDLGKNGSDRSTMLNDYFKISDNPLNEKILGGCHQEGRLENAWYRFKYRGRDFIIFALE
ncbi:MAG: metallophosphoesterase, partial [Planctomycetota bacterium]|nr:metallophosphoesterase [Planctomycetota bacterium]